MPTKPRRSPRDSAHPKKRRAREHAARRSAGMSSERSARGSGPHPIFRSATATRTSSFLRGGASVFFLLPSSVFFLFFLFLLISPDLGEQIFARELGVRHSERVEPPRRRPERRAQRRRRRVRRRRRRRVRERRRGGRRCCPRRGRGRPAVRARAAVRAAAIAPPWMIRMVEGADEARQARDRARGPRGRECDAAVRVSAEQERQRRCCVPIFHPMSTTWSEREGGEEGWSGKVGVIHSIIIIHNGL